MSNRPRLPSVKDLLNSPTPASASSGHVRRGMDSSDSNAHSGIPHAQYRDYGAPFSLNTQAITRSPTLPEINPGADQRWSQQHGGRLPSVTEVLQGSSAAPYTPGNSGGSTYHAARPGGSSANLDQRKGGFPCERCGRLFTRKSDAHKHIRVVHERLMVYSCRVCGRKFARKDYCVKHEKSLHNIAPPVSNQSGSRRGGKDKDAAGSSSGR